MSAHADPEPRHLVLGLAAATGVRVVLNTARRFPYPFAPALARALGVPFPGITGMIAASQLVSLLAPVAGPLADRRGYRPAMAAGLGMLAAGMLAAGAVFRYPVVFAAVVLAALGKAVFDPAIQAYIGRHVPLARRGRAIGLTETAWAGSTLVGIPLLGVVVAAFGWRAALLGLGACGLLGLVVLVSVLPDPPGARGWGRHRRAPPWREILAAPSARSAMAFGFLISLANDNLFVVYGAFLEQRFGLGLTALGAATAVVGVAELSGEGLTAALADRVGLGRALGLGALATAAGYALLPLAAGSLAGALASLFVLFAAYEFTVVTSFSVCTEVLPHARATLLSAYFAVLGVGRMTGALLGAPVWEAAGIGGTAAVSAAATALAALIWLRARPARLA